MNWIQGEDLAEQLYGDDWASKVRDVSDALFTDYVVAEPIGLADDYDIQNSINTNLDLGAVLYKRGLVENSFRKYILPEKTEILSYVDTGYTASSTLNIYELISWYEKQEIASNLVYEHTFQWSGALKTRALNYVYPVSGSFRHKSIGFVEGADGHIEISYTNKLFPVGFISYPYAINNINSLNNEEFTYTFITSNQPNEVIAWYKKVAVELGWVIIDESAASFYGGGQFALLRNTDNQQLILKWGTGTSDIGTQFQVTYSPYAGFLVK
ncbi:MAG: hypothetical protein GYA69_00015 [Candidatus Moranbacteria bacterium]|nr:hypothetical protein [Candidatus Moranbacteria bacterium]